MRRRLTLEIVVLLAAVACGISFWPRSPVDYGRPNVNGIHLGMTLKQARDQLPDYRAIQTADSRWALQGEGPYPDYVLLDYPLIFRDGHQAGVKNYTWAVTGSELSLDGHRLSAGSAESLAGWIMQFPDHRREQNLICWDFPDFVAWARFETPEATVPSSVGMGRYNSVMLDGLEQLHASELPVRPRGLLTQRRVTVDGISVGMTEEEVRDILGEPVEVNSYPRSTELVFLAHGDPGPATMIDVEHGRVRFVEGPGLEFEGKELAPPKGTLEVLFKAFGRADDTHARGFGGSTTYCWSNDEIVIEVLPDFEKGETIQRVFLLDPKGQERPHLWDTSCGTI